jgi:hypothetical protein
MFDELIRNDDDVEEDYFYTIEHRDADWLEENLIMNDYMSGFPENDIDEVNQSHGTVSNYRNFALSVPNDNVSLKLSGNYLIKIFERNSRELVLVKGFSIVEPLAAIGASLISPAVSAPCMQQFGIKVAYPSLRVIDAYRNLKVRVERNFTAVPGVEKLLPSFVQPNNTDYTRIEQNVFNGGNEYRAFDIRPLTYNGQGVARLSFDGSYRAELLQDEERTAYVAARDINGKYLIAAENASDPDTQAEYVETLFSFVPKTSLNGRIFVFGELTNWSISDRYELLPNDESFARIIPLKQGFYNYQYVILNDNGFPDMNAAEGCFFETENVYSVYVYFRLPELRYDRLIAFQFVSSRI